jgi:hypothetical protein
MRPGRDVDHSTRNSAEVTNEYIRPAQPLVHGKHAARGDDPNEEESLNFSPGKPWHMAEAILKI